ncbi:MAG: hypothetical protein NTV39_03000 [Candidatus Saccharibacteria bacterium]|nr:hypothetical protein [Candidatus Saccharibacteria bacterium]
MNKIKIPLKRGVLGLFTLVREPKVRLETAKALAKLRIKGKRLFMAAYPGYPGNFSRDSLIYGMLSGDPKALRAQVKFSAKHQGKRLNSITGEEPGKIHHELPAVVMNNKSSAYNACDTTALFLLAISNLYNAGHEEVLGLYAKNIKAGLEYIENHVHDGLFYEDPCYSGASDYALKVTYWKDSEMNDKELKPCYPIVYSLAHFQNAAAVEAIGQALHRSDLVDISRNMMDKGVEHLWAGDHFIVARDGNGISIDPFSSDSLYCLLYINPDNIPEGYAESVENYMKMLETRAGYLTGIACKDGIDDYHTRYIWTHEQALLHAASKRHSLDKSAQVAARITDFIDTFPELIDPTCGFKPAGNQPQLWAVGASQYFEDPTQSLL